MTADLTPAQAARLEAIADNLVRAVRDWHGPGGATREGLAGLGQVFRQALAVAAIDVMRGAVDDGAVGRVLAVCDDLDREGVVQRFHGPHNTNGLITDRIRAAVGAPATAEGDDRG